MALTVEEEIRAGIRRDVWLYLWVLQNVFWPGTNRFSLVKGTVWIYFQAEWLCKSPLYLSAPGSGQQWWIPNTWVDTQIFDECVLCSRLQWRLAIRNKFEKHPVTDWEASKRPRNWQEHEPTVERSHDKSILAVSGKKNKKPCTSFHFLKMLHMRSNCDVKISYKIWECLSYRGWKKIKASDYCWSGWLGSLLEGLFCYFMNHNL